MKKKNRFLLSFFFGICGKIVFRLKIYLNETLFYLHGPSVHPFFLYRIRNTQSEENWVSCHFNWISFKREKMLERNKKMRVKTCINDCFYNKILFLRKNFKYGQRPTIHLNKQSQSNKKISFSLYKNMRYFMIY